MITNAYLWEEGKRIRGRKGRREGGREGGSKEERGKKRKEGREGEREGDRPIPDSQKVDRICFSKPDGQIVLLAIPIGVLHLIKN